MKRVRPEENSVVLATARLLGRTGAKTQLREVQFCEKFLDLYAHKPGAGYIAVEAKVFAPTKAFRQASMYGVIAHRVYVAEMDTGKDSRAMRLAAETGIGLILVQRTKAGRFQARIEVEAKPSAIVNADLARSLWRKARRIYN